VTGVLNNIREIAGKVGGVGLHMGGRIVGLGSTRRWPARRGPCLAAAASQCRWNAPACKILL